MCFIKFVKNFTYDDYKEVFRHFNTSEKNSSGLMTSGRSSLFRRKYHLNNSCLDGKRIIPRSKIERNISFFNQNNLFRLIWKSNATRFNQAIEKKKLNFKVVNNVTIDKDHKSFVKYVQSSLFNSIGYDLDNYNKHRAFEYCCCIQTRSKISGKK